MSEKMVKQLNLKPIARMVSYATAGVDPRIMGIGPVAGQYFFNFFFNFVDYIVVSICF